ncbi:MAG: tetratricopeptide repeat protein [Thermoguttaceae bacterium]
MRTFNTRLAGILIAVAIVFGGGVYLLHGYQVRRNADVFLVQANQAEKQADEAAKRHDSRREDKARRDAVNYLKWYVRLMPNKVDSRERLGVMMLQYSHFSTVEDLQNANLPKDPRMFSQGRDQLETVLRQDPDRKLARRYLTQVAMLPMIRQYRNAREHLGILLKNAPRDAELLEWLGQCQEETGSLDAAIQTLKKAIECNPKQLTAYERLARLYRSGRAAKPKEADRVMEKLVEANPNSARAHFLRCRYLFDPRVARAEEGFKEIAKALQLDPDDADIILMATAANLVQGQAEKAREIIERGIKLHPAMSDMYVRKADVERRDGKPDKAIAALRQGLKSLSLDIDILWRLANALIDDNQLQEAQVVIEDLRKTNMAKENVNYLNARIQFAKENWRAAREAFEAVRPAAIDPRGVMARFGLVRQIDFWIGQCCGKLGNRTQQVEAYRRAVTVDPTFEPARTALIDTLAAMGRFDDAVQELRDWSTYGKVPRGASLQLARLLMMSNLRRAPAQRDWTAVEKALAEAERLMPNSPDIVLLRADVLRMQNREAEAEKLISEGMSKDAKQPAFLRARIVSAERRSDWAEAEKQLAELETVVGDGAAVRLERGQYLIRRYGKQEAAAAGLRKLAQNTQKFADSQYIELLGGLIPLAMQAGDVKFADELRRKFAEKQPNNVQVLYSFLDRALAAGDPAAAEKSLNDIERVAGQDGHWLFGKAMLSILKVEADKTPGKQREAFQKAIEYLTKAHEVQRDWSRIPLMMGNVYAALGMVDQSLMSYREAVDMGDRDVSAMARFLQLLMQTRQFAEAGKLVRQLEQEQGDRLARELLRPSAEIALVTGDTDRAVRLARKAVSDDSKSSTEQMWLAQILAHASRQAKTQSGAAKKAADLLSDAEKAARRAIDLDPKQPQAWVATARLFIQLGQEGKAEKLAQEAANKISQDEVHLALAQIYESLNKNETADEHYKAALAAAPKNSIVARAAAEFYLRINKIEAAETQLARLLDGKNPTRKDDLIWARQRQAMIYVTHGVAYQNNLPKARALIQKNLAEAQPGVLDRRLDAMVDAMDPDPVLRAQGVRKMEEMRKTQAASPEDRLALAQMYMHAGDWSKARSEFLGLVTSFDHEPRYLIAYILGLLQFGETSSAEMYIDRLETLIPRQFMPVSLRADLFVARKEPQKALAILRQFAEMTDVQPQEPAIRGRLVAEKLSQLRGALSERDKPAAEEFARQAENLAKKYLPQDRLSMAIFQASLGKVDEALDLFERAWEKTDSQEFSRVCGAIWDNGVKFSDKQVDRFNTIVEKASNKFGNPAQFQSMLAELRIRQARYAEAESLYREALEKNPNDAVAMNNLAVLLALRGVKLDEALALVNRAVEIAGRVGAMLDSRATIYIARNDADNALKDMLAAVKDADTPVRLFHLAQAYQVGGQPKEAKEVMKKALKQGLTREMLQPLEWPAFEKMKQSVK